jgi:Heavy metal binding domain
MRLRIAVFCGTLVLLAASLTGCESRPTTTNAVAPPAATISADSTAVPTAAAYICPMSCEGSASNKPGKCPVCDMTLEPVAASKPAG